VFSGHAHPFLSLSFSPALSGVGGGGGGSGAARLCIARVCDSGVENASFVLTLCFYHTASCALLPPFVKEH